MVISIVNIIAKNFQPCSLGAKLSKARWTKPDTRIRFEVLSNCAAGEKK